MLDYLSFIWYDSRMIEDLKELQEGVKGLLKFVMPPELPRSIHTRVISGDKSEVRVIIEVVKGRKKKWYQRIFSR
jgi:hypothetical protein